MDDAGSFSSGLVTGITTAGSTGDDSEGDDPDGDGGGSSMFDLGGADPDDPGSNDCAEVSEIANVGPQPADVIFLIDNSPSMDAEAGFVQDHMNAFSNQIIAANIDVHVVLVSEYPGDGAGVCIDPPLGSGGCPGADSNPPGFLHIDNYVGSHSALNRAIEHYPDYAGVLRPTAATHVVIVTDDDADMGAADFMAQFTPLDIGFADLTVHGIVAEESPVGACFSGSPCCGTSAAEGKVYKDLINQTGGVFGNLCDQQFQPIFDQLATEVIGGATLACEFEIPEAPAGEIFDRDEVNVEFTDGQGGVLSIGRVDDPSQCGSVSDGWYYDDPNTPTQIITCPQTCATIQGFAMASIAIKFGCTTIPAG